MKKHIYLLVALVVMIGCSKDDPEVINEQELITSVVYTLTPVTKMSNTVMEGGEEVTTVTYEPNGEEDIILTWEDLDGGGKDYAPTQSIAPASANLEGHAYYIGRITFWNKTTTPHEDITEEVKGEGADHQLFFNPQFDNVDVHIDYHDEDENGKPIGLKTILHTGHVGSSGEATGTIEVTLIHQPDKDGENVSEGYTANAGGDTDIAITYENIKVKEHENDH